MSFGDKAERRTYIYILCRARQVTDGDQNPTGKDKECYQCLQSLSLSMTQVFRRFLGPTKLKDYCKTYRNQGKFDINCVEFTTAWCSTDCEGYCTAEQHCSSICTSDFN